MYVEISWLHFITLQILACVNIKLEYVKDTWDSVNENLSEQILGCLTRVSTVFATVCPIKPHVNGLHKSEYGISYSHSHLCHISEEISFPCLDRNRETKNPNLDHPSLPSKRSPVQPSISIAQILAFTCCACYGGINHTPCQDFRAKFSQHQNKSLLITLFSSQRSLSHCFTKIWSFNAKNNVFSR